jgi:type I restriction enzyme S subunit
MKWENHQLKEISNYWTGKVEATTLDASNYVSTDNLIPDRGGIVNSNYVPITGNANSYSENDVLISNIRPYFKKIWFADKEGGCSNDVLVFRAKENVEPLFLYYQLSKDAFFDDMVAGSNGTKMPRGNKTSIMEFKLQIPPLPTQRKIASILSAYDDLIENNLKRIKLLEEKAEIVYKTEFDFFKPSNEINKLPIGWKVQRADEIFRINIGKTPPREQQEWFNDIDSGVKWVSIKDINNSTVFLLNTSETVTENAVNKFNMNVAKSDTVILSFKLTVGKVAITTEEMVTNEAIAHFNIDDETKMNSEFIYFYLKNFPYDSLGSTSSIGTAINSKIVKAMTVLLPSEKVIEDFGKNVKPAFQLIKTLLKQNTKLREARDILLPKLMNGQITV